MRVIALFKKWLFFKKTQLFVIILYVIGGGKELMVYEICEREIGKKC